MPTGTIDLPLDLAVDGAFQFDPGRCVVVWKLDERELLRETFAWQDYKLLHYSRQEHLAAGDHRLTFEIEPQTPPEKQLTTLDMRIVSLKVQGPLDPKFWTRPANYDRFFPRTRLLKPTLYVGSTPAKF